MSKRTRILCALMSIAVFFSSVVPAGAALLAPPSPAELYDTFTSVAEQYANDPNSPKTVAAIAAETGMTEGQVTTALARAKSIAKATGGTEGMSNASLGNLAAGILLCSAAKLGVQAASTWLCGTTTYYDADGNVLGTDEIGDFFSLDAFSRIGDMTQVKYARTDYGALNGFWDTVFGDENTDGLLTYYWSGGVVELAAATSAATSTVYAAGSSVAWPASVWTSLPHGIQAYPAAPSGCTTSGAMALQVLTHSAQGGGVVGLDKPKGYEFSATYGKIYMSTSDGTGKIIAYGPNGDYLQSTSTYTSYVWLWNNGVPSLNVSAAQLNTFGSWLDSEWGAGAWYPYSQLSGNVVDLGIAVAPDAGSMVFDIADALADTNQTLAEIAEAIKVPAVAPANVINNTTTINNYPETESENKTGILEWLGSFWESLTEWVRGMVTIADPVWQDQIQPEIARLKLSAQQCWPFAGAYVVKSAIADAQSGSYNEPLEWFLDLTPPDNTNVLKGETYGVWIRPLTWLEPVKPYRWALVASLGILWLLALYSLLKPKVHV